MQEKSIISKDSVKVNYFTNQNTGNCLFFVHSWPYNHTEWNKQIRLLEKNHKIIAVDMRGFGNSDKPRDKEYYDIKRICEDFSLILDNEKIKKVTMVGHCSGGMIVIDFYRYFPDYCKSVILVGCPYKDPLNCIEGPFGTKFGRGLAWIMSFIVSRFKIRKYFNFDGYESWKNDKLKRIKRFLDAIRYTKIRIVNYYFDYIAKFNGADVLKNIKVPLLMIYGEHDDFCGQGLKECVAGEVSGKVVFVKGCTHFPQNDRPEEVKSLIESFVK
jgi:pimeloyl-ACP methyl ester carboxylesterase